MQRMMLKSKIHRATVTDADLEYEGSLTIDKTLMQQADIKVFERVEIYNVANGQRFATYAIEGEAGSGVICANGAAAHLVKRGDKVIICTYGYFSDSDAAGYPGAFTQPKILLVNEKNQIKNFSPI